MTDKALTVRDDMTLSELGSVLAKSGFFSDTRDAAQAIVKVLAGREMGFGAIQSMTGINIIQGRVAPSANLMAAAVKRSGKYNYRVTEHTDKTCEIMFTEQGQDIGHSRFTIEDARKAGTKNLDKFPRNMLFARAMSNGVRWFTPDVFSAPVYTPEELGANVNEEGDVIENAKPVNGHEQDPLSAIINVTTGEIVQPTEEAAMKEAAQPEPAPAPSPAAEPIKFATIKNLSHQGDWKLACNELARTYPAYQTVLKGGAPSGQPNFHHILGAAAKCGYATITDDNYESVIEAIAARAAVIAEALKTESD